MPPKVSAAPPSKTTPPVVSARTVTGLVRLANRAPIQSEFEGLAEEAVLTRYVPLATTMSVTALLASAVSRAGMDVTRTDKLGAGVARPTRASTMVTMMIRPRTRWRAGGRHFGGRVPAIKRPAIPVPLTWAMGSVLQPGSRGYYGFVAPPRRSKDRSTCRHKHFGAPCQRMGRSASWHGPGRPRPPAPVEMRDPSPRRAQRYREPGLARIEQTGGHVVDADLAGSCRLLPPHNNLTPRFGRPAARRPSAPRYRPIRAVTRSRSGVRRNRGRRRPHGNSSSHDPSDRDRITALLDPCPGCGEVRPHLPPGARIGERTRSHAAPRSSSAIPSDSPTEGRQPSFLEMPRSRSR